MVNVPKAALCLFGVYAVVSIALHIHHLHALKQVKSADSAQPSAKTHTRKPRSKWVMDAGSMPTPREFEPTWAMRYANIEDQLGDEIHEMAVHTGRDMI
jgi:hypothetical protein